MNDVYTDIAQRTGGDIMIGVVGPVRSGKSTFINKFMEKLVIPNIAGKNKKQIAQDELPQSAQGKTVMTTEPKFVPGEAVTVKLDKAQARVRLIDCVGYMVDGAVGLEENGQPRLVKTPWQDEEMTFEKASEYGTQKVISEHSTVGIVVTCDGSFTEIDRKAYQKAEQRVVGELKTLGKPFIVVYNTTKPEDDDVISACKGLEEKYGVAVIPADVAALDENNISRIFERLLLEFPMRVINVKLPKWVQALPEDHEVVVNAVQSVKKATAQIDKMSAYKLIERVFSDGEHFTEAVNVELDMGTGAANFTFDAKPDLFYKVMAGECGEEVGDKYDLINYVRKLKTAKEGYAKVKEALSEALSAGYGIVPAKLSKTAVDEPKVVKKNGQYCVKIRVGAESLHVVKADVRAEVEVISGTKEQCDKFAETLKSEEGEGLDTEVFGRSVNSMLEEALVTRSVSLAEPVRQKLKRTVNKAVNEKKSNLICILI